MWKKDQKMKLRRGLYDYVDGVVCTKFRKGQKLLIMALGPSPVE